MVWVKRGVILLLLAGMVGLAALGLRPQPVPVETADVTRGPLQVVVEATGQTRVRERHLVSAPVSGKMARITLRAGDVVTAGREIARIEPPASMPLDLRTRAEIEARAVAAEAALAQAEAMVEQARLARSQAYRERERARSTAAAGLVTGQQLDAAEFELRLRAREVDAAELAVERARREVEAVRSPLGPPLSADAPEHVAVQAPVAGRVLRVLFESEGPVAAGTPLIEIGDPGALEVIIDVLTADAVRIAPDAAVELRGWGGQGTLEGRVRLVEPSAFTRISALGIEEQRVLVVVDPAGDVEAWRALGDGYRVEARIAVRELADTLRAPSGALFRERDGWAAFVVEKGRASRRPVEVGERCGDLVEVTGGLAEGEAVILHPSDQVTEGVEVQSELE